MRIRFKTSVADAHSSFVRGRVVSFPSLPLGWEKWLAADIIEVLPEDRTERAEAPDVRETAISQPARGRRPSRRAHAPA